MSIQVEYFLLEFIRIGRSVLGCFMTLSGGLIECCSEWRSLFHEGLHPGLLFLWREDDVIMDFAELFKFLSYGGQLLLAGCHYIYKLFRVIFEYK